MRKNNFKKVAAIVLSAAVISATTAWAIPKAAPINEGVQVIAADGLEKNDGVGIQLNGRLLQLDEKPFVKNGRTLIPLRGIMENLGAKVDWVGTESKAIVNFGYIRIELVVGEDTAKIIRNTNEAINEDIIKLDVPSVIVDGRTYIPGRFVMEALGAKIDWIEETNTMVIEIEDDIKGTENSIDFEVVDKNAIIENDDLYSWYQANYKTKGIYTFTYDEWMYVLTSDGEKPTGGYSLEIKSITKTEPNSAYIYAVLNSPGKDDIVTQALTYPSVIVRFAKGDIQQVDWNLAPSNDVIEGEIDKSLEEMGKAISLNSVKEGKLYSLMQEELKIFTPEEAKNIIDKLNTSPTYNGPYIEMLAGNSIKIFLEDDGIIHLTSYGNEEHVIMSVQINGEYSTYCIVNSEIGRILLQDAKQRPFFESCTGTVKEITESDQGKKTVFVEDEYGNPVYFILSNNTYYLDNVEIAVGDEITGYYEADRPMILIYPPQISMDVITGKIQDQNIKVDMFDDDLVSNDKTLKLNISDKTQIIMAGTNQELSAKDIANKKLIVFYIAATKSIPSQTTPTKIIVLP